MYSSCDKKLRLVVYLKVKFRLITLFDVQLLKDSLFMRRNLRCRRPISLDTFQRIVYTDRNFSVCFVFPPSELAPNSLCKVARFTLRDAI